MVIFLCEAHTYTYSILERNSRGARRRERERQITDAVLSIRLPIICNVYLMFDFLLSQGQIASRDTSNI